MTIVEDATSFLVANGWLVTQLDSVLISGTRPSLGDLSDQVLVWVPATHDPEGVRAREAGYLRRFGEYAQAQGQKFLLVETTEGLSADFRRRAKSEFRVTVTVPAQFFDAPFKWEASASTATAASALRNRDVGVRIPQPFSSSEDYGAHDDLLTALLPLFRASAVQGPSVHVVTAPAGYGKSHLFATLFSRLYDDFVDAKRAQVTALRPLPLLPEYLAAATAPTLKALVASFLATDVARPLSLDSFEWMLTHGHGCFLLDGLDELIARDPHFFDYLYDLLTRPDVPYQPKILVCVRDSLLASNKGLRDFLDDAGSLVARHRLEAWKRPSIDAFVARSRPPQAAGKIKAILDSNPTLLVLAGTPYYCDLIATELSKETASREALASITSGSRLMALAVEEMVGREFDKSLLSRHWVARSDVESLVQDIAEENLEGGSKGVAIDVVEELAVLSLTDGLGDEELKAAVEQLKQLPFFSPTSDLGRLSFSQEVVYDYLLGARAATYFASNPKRFLIMMGLRPLSAESATLLVLREKILAEGSLDDLFRAAANASGDQIAFRNVLQLILSIDDAHWIVRRLSLERQDLSGIVFSGLDLDGVSLRGSNLEAAVFKGCRMSGAVLAEAVVQATVFADCTGLSEVELGDLSTFFSASVDAQHVEDASDLLSAIGMGAPVGGAGRFVRPCAAANQLRFLFSKFVRPDGAPRRDWLDEKAALAGRRYVDPGPVVAAALRHGYLEVDPGRARYLRSRGVDYSEMVGLVSKLQLSAKMKVLLADVCRQPGCRHVLEVDSTEV